MDPSLIIIRSHKIWWKGISVFAVVTALLLASVGIAFSQTNSQTVRLRSNVTLAPDLGSESGAYQWRFKEQDVAGATNASLSLSDVRFTNEGLYSLVLSNSTGVTNFDINLIVTPVIIWGYNDSGQTNVPPGLSNIVAITAGGSFIAALRDTGSVVVWGDNTYGETNVPPDLTNVVAISAGEANLLALRSDGTVYAWGQNGEGETNIPAGLSNVVAIACGAEHDLAVKADGTVVAWGFNLSGQTSVPLGLNTVVAVAGGLAQSLALRSDGTVTAWGEWFCGQTNVPAGLLGIAAVAASTYNSFAVAEDGGLDIWGCDYDGGGYPPGGLGPVSSIDADGGQTIALLRDGTVSAWGFNYLQHWWSVPEGVTNAIAVAAGSQNNLVLINDGKPVIVRSPRSKVVFTNSTAVLNVAAVGAAPLTYQWRKNGSSIVSATNAALTITNVVFDNGGPYDVVVSNALGQVISASAFINVTDTGDALNAPYLAWTNTGDLPWLPVSAGSHDGIMAFQTGAVGGGQRSILETTVSGPGALEFWWKCSTITGGCVSLSFYLDNVGQMGISGLVDWQPVTVYLPAGQHSLQWTFFNNCYGGVGTGTGWLDEVSYIPGGSLPTITNSPTDQMVTAGLNTSFQVAGYGTPPLQYQWRLNGTEIPGATNAVLQITNAQQANVGLYTAVVSNDFGFATADATLTVNPFLAIKSHPQSIRVLRHATADFAVAVMGSQPFAFQWQLNGSDLVGATNATLHLDGCRIDQSGTYRVVVSNSFGIVISSNALLEVSPAMVVAWGDRSFGLTNIPPGLTNVTEIAAGLNDDLALTEDGQVVVWGDNSDGETNVPPGLDGVVSIAAGAHHCLALKSDGSVVSWGFATTAGGQLSVPAGLTNVHAIAAGAAHSTVLLSNGTVLCWGSNIYGQTNSPAGLTNVVAIAAGDYHNLALKRDGTVAAWGGGTNISFGVNLGQSMVPMGLSNVIAIAGGRYLSVALKSDGTVIAWGDNSSGETNVPSSLGQTVAIAAGVYHALAIRSDRTIAAWGAGTTVVAPPNLGQSDIPAAFTNAIAIAAGGFHSLAMINDGSPAIIRNPVSQSVSAGMEASFDVVAVGSAPLSYQWRYNGSDLIGDTNSILLLTNVPLSGSGDYQCIVSNTLDTVKSTIASLQVTRSQPAFDPQYPFRLTKLGFNLRLIRLSGHGSIVIYCSSNLLDWTPLLTNPPVLGTMELIDTEATNTPIRFYRAQEQ